MAVPYKLRVLYVGELNEDMDLNMIKIAEQNGYELVATGYNFKSEERELNFELKG